MQLTIEGFDMTRHPIPLNAYELSQLPCACGRGHKREWMDTFCQECWEAYCAASFWEAISVAEEE